MKKLLLLLIIVFTFSSCDTWTCIECSEKKYYFWSTRYISDSSNDQCIPVEDPDYKVYTPQCKDCCTKKHSHIYGEID